MAKILTDGLGIQLHGKAGNAVFVQTKNGLILRPYTVPKDPKTPAQQARRARFARAAGTFKTLTPAQHALWQAYAQTVSRQDARGGKPRISTPYHAFVGLANKYLQVHPDDTPPLLPPTAPFFGDGITFAAVGGAGLLTFTASGPNAASIVTELLVQPLAHAGRAPKSDKYRPQAFVGFVSGSLSHAVSVAPGWYAPAIRFVNARTGQEAGFVRLTVVQVR